MTRMLAVLLASAVLAGCGEGDDAPSSPTPAPQRDAPTAEGTGYAVEPPAGFRDVTSSFDGSAVRIDLAYADQPRSGFATNIVVIREEPGGAVELDDVMTTFAEQAEGQATDAGISEIEDRELDGVPAKTYSFRSRNDQRGPVHQRQVVAVKDGAIYTITWSVAADEFEAQEATLDRTLASWRWS
jgi:hypothetical protein